MFEISNAHLKHSASERLYLQIWRVFSRYACPFSPVAKLGVVSAGNRIPITIPRREKNPEQKILFFRGEILILVFEVGLFLENLQNFRILYRVSLGILGYRWFWVVLGSFLAHFGGIFRIQTSIFKCLPFQGYWEFGDVAGCKMNLRMRVLL